MALAQNIYTNVAESTIADIGGISSGATSFSVASGEGARFPAASNSASPPTQFMGAFLDSSGNVLEYVLVTNRSTDTLTITRAAEDATRFPAASRAQNLAFVQIVPASQLAMLMQVRKTATHTTSSLANNASEQSTISMATGYRLLKISTSVAARVEIYTTAAAQTADASRAVGTDPGVGAGVILDYVTTSGLLTAELSPMVDGFSLESSPSTSISLTTTNLSGSTGTVTVTLTYIRTE
jgi:hypothetical protein